MTSSLEERLFALELPLPKGLVLRAAAAATQPARRASGVAVVRPVAIGALSLGAFVGINAVAGHVWPAYGRLLADVPGARIVPGWLDPRTGLVPQTATPLNASATSAGHEVRLIGGSADGVRTLLFVEIDGKSYSDVNDPPRFSVGAATITDRNGNVYKQLPYGHNFIPAFEPLRGAAADGGPLTLHITELLPAEPGDPVRGDWTMRFTLVAEPLLDVRVPAAIVTSGTTYEVVSVRASREVLDLHWRATGEAVAQFTALIADPPAMTLDPTTETPGGAGGGPVLGRPITVTPEFQAYSDRIHAFMREHFEVSLVAPSGETLHPFSGGSGAPKDGAVEGDATLLLRGPGRYFVRFGTVAEMSIDIP
jgi:hypothetical protein